MPVQLLMKKKKKQEILPETEGELLSAQLRLPFTADNNIIVVCSSICHIDILFAITIEGSS